MHQTILHPTDFSDYSDLAFQLACSLARDHGARLVVVNVMSPDIVRAEAHEIPVEVELSREAHLEQLEQMQKRQSKIQIESKLMQGEPTNIILTMAKELPADLIVLGSHGRTGLSRLLMGSVAEEIVRKATCPVLVVKKPAEAS